MQSSGGGNSDTNPYSSHTYSDANYDGDSDRNSLHYSYSYSYSNRHGYCDTNSDPDTESYPNVNSNRYSYSQYDTVQLCFRTRRLERPCRVAGHRVAAWQCDLHSRGIAIDFGK